MAVTSGRRGTRLRVFRVRLRPLSVREGLRVGPSVWLLAEAGEDPLGTFPSLHQSPVKAVWPVARRRNRPGLARRH